MLRELKGLSKACEDFNQVKRNMELNYILEFFKALLDGGKVLNNFMIR